MSRVQHDDGCRKANERLRELEKTQTALERELRCRSCQRGDVRMGEVCGHCGDTNPLGVRELGMEEEHGD